MYSLFPSVHRASMVVQEYLRKVAVYPLGYWNTCDCQTYKLVIYFDFLYFKIYLDRKEADLLSNWKMAMEI